MVFIPAKIIDGKKISQEILDEVKLEIENLVKSGKRPPALAMAAVGSDPASAVYARNKRKVCEKVGIKSVTHELPAETDESGLAGVIEKLNADPGVDGILLELPLPKHIREREMLYRLNPAKDVEGLHPYNAGLLSLGAECLPPCTPAGIVELIKRSGIAIEGKRCVVIGRSNIVGKPAALLLLKENGTVTVCHSKTAGLAEICRQADILVAAVGKKEFVTPDMVKDGAVVIDAGIHESGNGRGLCGDVDAACAEKASYFTPVPGGVGPMTAAVLMRNCLEAYKKTYGRE